MDLEPDHYTPQSASRAATLIAPQQRPEVRGTRALLRALSPAERLLLYALSLVLGVSAFFLLANANTSISTEVPTQGGALVEGAVGTPRFVNPLLAVSHIDQDLTMLVYSGLLRATPAGEYETDLAESVETSDDGTIYTFHLREGLSFHDGTPLTADDVLFTVALAQNPEVKSPRRADWEGVAVTAPDDRTIVFTLPHAYAPFRENATLGILPKHLWENVTPEEFPFSAINTHPVGSGPYRVKDVALDQTGAPSVYDLASFSRFALGEPNITRLHVHAYANTEEMVAAFEKGDIESFLADSPKSLARGLQESGDLMRAPLARTFGVFLNQNHAPALAAIEVRAALAAAIDKEALVQEVLGGFGVVLSGPVPPHLLEDAEATSTPPADRIAEARDILSRNGWKYDDANGWKKDKTTLSISLATADTEELVQSAEKVAAAWNAAGIKTEVHVYPLTEFNQTILRPRAYDAILFGEVVGRSLDLFAFWHSSQRNDPGLNLALYTSSAADKALADARASSDSAARQEHLRAFLEEVAKDKPAVFLYAPEIAYILPSRLQGVELGTLTTPADRFLTIHTWYRDTERVWNIFSK